MGRPLTGSLRHHQGSWWASVPAKRGGARRREEAFRSEADAKAWLAQAVTALKNDQPIPDPERFRTTKPRRTATPAPPPPAKLSPDIASVAHAWMAAAYEDLRRGGPERAERVRRLVEGFLIPWFAPRTTTVSDVSYFMAHEWLLHLVGRNTAPRRRTSAAPGLPGAVGDQELSLAQAADAAGVSLPTARRRWRAGQLPGAYRASDGQVRVPVAAVAAITTKRRAPTGLSQSYVADALWVLRRVLAFARANGLFPPGFDPTEGLDAPLPDKGASRKPRAGQPRPLTLPECARIASHLHPPHQIALWLQRIMGLRISEAFGITVADVIDHGDTGLLAVQGQGGRTFNVRDDHGQIVAVPYKAILKTAAGSRVLVVPPKLMELLRVAIEAFHTDPDTGAVDTQARLIPGLQRKSTSGQQGYFHAFENAVVAEHLSGADLGFSVSSHLLRKSCATDLAWAAGIEDAVRRRFMGHRAGDDVYGRIYTLDHPDVAPLTKVAEILDHNIAITIGTLLTPTIRHIQWGADNPLIERADHIAATLAAAGWLVDPGKPDDPLCDAARVADELDIYPTTARRWMRDGTLPAVTLVDARGIPRPYVRLSDVWAHREQLAGRILLPDLAEQLGMRYHEAYHALRRLGLAVEQHPSSREYHLTKPAADDIRAEHERIRALHRRSMKLAAAARKLRIALSTAGVLSRTGQLEVDPETDSSGARFVTRASVGRCWIARRARTKHGNPETQTAVPVAEVARFTGRTTREILDLVRAGDLEQLPGRRYCEITASSLQSWLSPSEA